MELPPKLWRHFLMRMQADDNLRGMKLVKGVLNAVGNVGRYAHLRLRSHVGGGGVFRHLV